MTVEATENIEYLKIAFAFGGALVGGAIGTPLIEWFKDRLGAKRQWKTQRNEIVATLRLMIGILEAFRELRISAFGWPGAPVEFSHSGFESLKLFDFTLFNNSLVKLSALHPDDSSRSAVGQRLVQYLIVLGVRFRQLQSITPVIVTQWRDKATYPSLSEDDQKTLQESDQEFDEFKSFLYILYARRLGIDQLSLILDKEVSEFIDAMRQARIKNKVDELHRLQAQTNSVAGEKGSATDAQS